jgi:hypothetical protein
LQHGQTDWIVPSGFFDMGTVYAFFQTAKEELAEPLRGSDFVTSRPREVDRGRHRPYRRNERRSKKSYSSHRRFTRQANLGDS